MIYGKSILAGIAAIAIYAIVVAAVVALPVILVGGYFGFDFEPSLSGSVFLLIIFAAGFYWEFRRLSKPHSSPS